MQYIDYEVKLLKEIKLRRDKYRKSEKKADIEYVISKKIVKLYQALLGYFPNEVKIWTSFINFCTHTKFWNVVTQAFQQMLQVYKYYIKKSYLSLIKGTFLQLDVEGICANIVFSD